MKVDNDAELVWAVIDAVHELLEQNRAASIPGLGVLAVKYTKSERRHTADGSTTIIPPVRKLTFTDSQG